MRELSLNERIALMNVLRTRTYTGRNEDGIMATTESFRRHVPVASRTLEEHHDELDAINVPRFTNNPYHTSELLPSANEVGNSLRMAIVNTDGKFNTINQYTKDWLLEQSLIGNLKRGHKNDMYYKYSVDGSEPVIIGQHCGFIRSMVDGEYYTYMVTPKES